MQSLRLGEGLRIGSLWMHHGLFWHIDFPVKNPSGAHGERGIKRGARSSKGEMPAFFFFWTTTLAMVPWRYRNAYFLGTCTAPHAAGECPAGAWTRDRAIELQRRGEHGASDPLLFPAYQENTVTARLRACGVPVRIAPSPQYLVMGVMPVRPRWGNCTPHDVTSEPWARGTPARRSPTSRG